MRVFIVASVSAIIAASGAASPFRIEPPAPDTHSFISITIGGAWKDTCVPHNAQMTILGSTITIVASAVLLGGGCGQAITLWEETVYPGVLAPATYDVRAFIDTNSGRIELGRTQLTVRAAEPFRAFPSGAPISGGTEVRLVSDNAWTGTLVTFGDAPPVEATPVGPKSLVVTAPSHAAGTVDIVVGSLTAVHAFTFYDPSAPPDRSIFEPLLFPVAFTGGGAHDSSWVTDNFIDAPAFDPTTFYESLPCSGCSSVAKQLVRLEANDPSGLLLHVARGTAGSLALSSRIRDLSRQAQSAGTAIPIVRERDWRLRALRLINIPNDDRVRMTLRVWSDHDAPVTVFISLGAPGAPSEASTTRTLTRDRDGVALYAQIDLDALSARVRSDQARYVRIQSSDGDPDVRLWALISITNNDTQHVTIISPQ